jgi:RNA polymerase sigma-70 factor (ECF subfamily)
MSEHTDADLIRLFRIPSSRESAFNQIIARYKENLYWHIRKIVISHDDTDDILQDCFVKVWNSLDNFREDSGIYTWLFRIATNEALSFLRSKKKRNFVPWPGNENHLTGSLASELIYDGDALAIKLQQAVLSLPEKQRLVFNMKYYDDMKYEDIAAILGTSVGALKASYHHAVKKIENLVLKD